MVLQRLCWTVDIFISNVLNKKIDNLFIQPFCVGGILVPFDYAKLLAQLKTSFKPQDMMSFFKLVLGYLGTGFFQMCINVCFVL